MVFILQKNSQSFSKSIPSPHYILNTCPITYLFDDGGHNHLWCRQTGTILDGRRRFFVINGEWTFFLNSSETEMYIPGRGETHPIRILWEGSVPRDIYETAYPVNSGSTTTGVPGAIRE